jgi:hypothetical protein
MKLTVTLNVTKAQLQSCHVITFILNKHIHTYRQYAQSYIPANLSYKYFLGNVTRTASKHTANACHVILQILP